MPHIALSRLVFLKLFDYKPVVTRYAGSLNAKIAQDRLNALKTGK
jgi:hypothetical protein